MASEAGDRSTFGFTENVSHTIFYGDHNSLEVHVKELNRYRRPGRKETGK